MPRPGYPQQVPRRVDSIRTRHLGGVTHGSVQRAGVVVPAEHLDTPPDRAPLLTAEEADARRLINREQAAMLTGMTPAAFSTAVNMGRVEVAAYVRAGARGGARASRFDPVTLTQGC